MTFPKHSPLNAIDIINQPPLEYLQVQDALLLFIAFPWSIAYVLYVVQAYRDKSYGMPLLALCSNIAWEIVYAYRFPKQLTEILTLVPWIVIDSYLVYTTIKFGPDQWKHAPLVAQNLSPIIVFGIAFMIGAHSSFAEVCALDMDALFWSAFACQVVLGWASVAQLVSRGNTSGHSRTIWLCRFIGSTSAALLYYWRVIHYPEDYWMASTPFGIFLLVASELGDVCYPPIFSYVSRQNKKTKVT